MAVLWYYDRFTTKVVQLLCVYIIFEYKRSITAYNNLYNKKF